MIPADQQELITAAVDGELSAAEVRAFRRLLAESAEARGLYAKLKADRDRVRSLPRATPPPDLQARVLMRIAAAAVTPVVSRAHTEPARRRTSAWVPVAAAASLLFGVTAVSFAYFNHQSRVETAADKGSWAAALPAVQEAAPAVPSPATAARPDPNAVARLEVSPVPPAPHPRPASEAVAVAPEPRPKHDLIGARPLPPLPPLDRVQLHIPFLRAVAELERDDTRQELTDELARDPVAFRLDLFVRDTARGVEVFQNAAKVAGVTLFADATTLERLKKKQVASVVIYTESLTAAELTALFSHLCTEDMKFSPRVYDSLHATPVVPFDEKELKLLLGTDVGLFKRPAGSAVGQGERGDKSVSAGTIDSVSKSLNGQPVKPGGAAAVLTTWQTTHPAIPRTNPLASDEIKQYNQKRGPRKPNVVPAVVVIRPAG